ncbi:unnamed protein product [Chrysoparadoxa australica]
MPFVPLSPVERTRRLSQIMHGAGGGVSPRRAAAAAHGQGTEGILELAAVKAALQEGCVIKYLTEQERAEVSAAMRPVSCKAGQPLMLNGQICDLFLVVEKGVFTLMEYHCHDAVVELSSTARPTPKSKALANKGGMSQVLCGAGSCFGEINLVLPHVPVNRSLVCARDGGVVWQLSQDNYRKIMARESMRVRDASLRALRGVPLLKQLTGQQLMRVADRVEVRLYKEGEHVLLEDDVTSALHIIKEGSARVRWTRGASGKVTALMREGDYFGEMALVRGTCTGFNVKAKEDLLLYRLDRNLLESLLGPVDTSLERGSYLKALATMPMLHNMSAGERMHLLDLFKAKSYGKGSMIISRGEKSLCMYLLTKGKVGVIARDPDSGAMSEVAEIRPVDYFGERALIESDMRNASVVAKTNVNCLVLERRAFNEAFGPATGIATREQNVRAPMPMAGADLRHIAVMIEDGGFGQVSLAEQMGLESPTAKESGAKTFSIFNPMFGPSVRRVVVAAAKCRRAEATKEAMLLGGRNTFIVHMFGWFEQLEHIHLVLEYVEGGSLARLIADEPEAAMANPQFYAGAVLAALSHLHQRDIVFRGLHPKAILLDWSGYPRLTDFCFARELKAGQAYTLCGWEGYQAPEVVLGNGYGCQSDYWSFGCLIYELVSGGRPPFLNESGPSNPSDMLKRAMAGTLDFAVLDKEGNEAFSPECQSLVTSLVQPNPLERNGCSRGDLDVRDSAWYHGFSWEELLEKRMQPPWVPPEHFMRERTERHERGCAEGEGSPGLTGGSTSRTPRRASDIILKPPWLPTTP